MEFGLGAGSGGIAGTRTDRVLVFAFPVSGDSVNGPGCSPLGDGWASGISARLVLDFALWDAKILSRLASTFVLNSPHTRPAFRW